MTIFTREFDHSRGSALPPGYGIPDLATLSITSPVGGNAYGSQQIIILNTTPSSTVRYTIDGSTPTTSSPLYTGNLRVGQIVSQGGSVTLKVRSFQDDRSTPTVSATYTGIATPTPTITPVAETYFGDQLITIACAEATATIRYTTDGSAPTTSHGTVYTGPFTVASFADRIGVGFNITAVAYNDYYTSSSTAVVQYQRKQSAVFSELATYHLATAPNPLASPGICAGAPSASYSPPGTYGFNFTVATSGEYVTLSVQRGVTDWYANVLVRNTTNAVGTQYSKTSAPIATAPAVVNGVLTGTIVVPFLYSDYGPQLNNVLEVVNPAPSQITVTFGD